MNSQVYQAFEKSVIPAGAPPLPDSSLNVSVIFTGVAETLAALRRAAALAAELNARVTLFVLQVVPYPLPVTSPPVLLEFNERRFRLIAETARVETVVLIYLCREPQTAIEAVLPPRSLIVIGGRKHWWPTREAALARRLRRAGHEVVFTETE